ncbi:MAG: ATP-binding protein [Treponema sp.]|uniref:AAA family ATPase n=1 Tax=Treponema sp. TaxID=166 RepID=UPI0025F5511C|nr:ATP-binding protein [Treponema sp.]MBQ9283310.1 ATP-binding protein [Treponema sp.]
MLLKFFISNFYSIKDTLTVDFEAERISTERAKALADNVFSESGKKYLKSIGVFGPNASGKSSIYKALLFCDRLVLESHINNEGATFNFMPFKFDGYHEKPSKFCINFICDGTEYEYSFSLTRKEIVSESLYYYPGKRKAKIFTRNEQVGKSKSEIFSFADGFFVKPMDVAQSTGRNTLFISRASQMDRELAKKIYNFFLTELYVGVPQIRTDYAVGLFEKNKPLIIEALRMADSDIVDIEVRKEKINVPAIAPDLQFGIPAIQTEVITRFFTTHKRNSNIKFDLYAEESTGTIQIFSLLIVLLDICKRGKTLVVDEFDLSLHTELAEFIINMVHASKGAQLLFTSHNTNLIDVKKFRRDQICFTNKRDDGSTEFYSLFDFKDFRENMDAEKGYLQGRFDAVPYVTASVEEIRKLFGE